jgi:hypothetical protein
MGIWWDVGCNDFLTLYKDAFNGETARHVAGQGRYEK